MPFKKGVATPGAGRKGYVLEQKQLEKMRRILNTDIAMVEKLQKTKGFDPFLIKKLDVLQARILKYSDKLHASKGELKHSGDIVSITPEDQAAANKAILDYIKSKKK